MKQAITDFEVIDHGIDNSQYFPGCGVSFSRFEHVVTGCGDTFAEAVNDALDSIAQSDHDVENMEVLILADAPKDGDSVPKDSEDCYYYVSIRYNVAAEVSK